jgi:NAD+ kinase
VLGINRGRLGFLTDIRPEEVRQKVSEVLDGKYRVEERFLLDIKVIRHGELIARAEALNDVVVNSGRSARMIDFDLYMGGRYVYSQDSDGLIVSTPTGSTAYALSGGGPIMHPELDAIVLVPMFPHTLSARPIVVAGDTEIKVVIGDCHPYISCDGQVHLTAAPEDVVLIGKKPHKLKLIHLLDHDFYAACRDKLGWGNQLAK